MPCSDVSLRASQDTIKMLEDTVKTLLATVADFDPQIDGRVDKDVSDLQSNLAYVQTRLSVVKKQVASHIWFREWRESLLDRVLAIDVMADDWIILVGPREFVLDRLASWVGRDDAQAVLHRMEKWITKVGWELHFEGECNAIIGI